MLDRINCPYRDLENAGFFLPVLDCEAKFIKPAHFDDRLSIRVSIKELPVARIKIHYEVYRNEERLCIGSTTHAFINKIGKLVRPPEIFLEKTKRNFST